MTSGVLWNVKGVRPELRQTAREAARRSGMSVGQWLNNVIADSVADQDAALMVSASGIGSCDGTFDDEITWRHGSDLAQVRIQLEDLTRRLGQITRPSVDPAGGRPQPGRPVPQQLVRAIAQIDRQLDQLLAEQRPEEAESGPAEAAGVDEAFAEIAARMRALDGETPAAPPVGFDPAAGHRAVPARTEPADGPVLSRLEQQLRHITAQIESIRRPCGVEQEVTGLRAELADIRRALTEALPRRAVESLEIEVKALAERIDHVRQAVGGASLAGVERGLSEVREALRTLTPAEGLIGFDDAVLALSRKIDTLVASSQDPAALQQLEAAIALLRNMVSHVASNDALTALADEVRSLAAKVDRVANSNGPAGNAFAALEQRITMLAEALREHNATGHAAPLGLESAIAGLSEKLQAIEPTRGERPDLGRIENGITQLVARLDDSDHRLRQIVSIEPAIAELRTRVEALRAGEGAGAGAVGDLGAIDELKRDLAEFKTTERRTQISLESIQGMLGRVADRIATIEQGLKTKPVPRAPATTAAAPHVRLTPSASVTAPPLQPAGPGSELETAVATARAPAAAPAVAAPMDAPVPTRTPIDPDLPPDHPLEPGSGTTRPRVAVGAAERVAASEAALGPAKPPVIPDPAGKSNFIAAARRAAQAAAASQTGEQRKPATAASEPAGKTLTERLRKYIVGASVVLIVVGMLHALISLFGSASPEPPAPAATENSTPRSDAGDAKQSADGPAAAPAGVPTSPPPNEPAIDRQSQPRPDRDPAEPPSPRASAPTPDAARGEPTGTVARPLAEQAALAPAAPVPLLPAARAVPAPLTAPTVTAPAPLQIVPEPAPAAGTPPAGGDRMPPTIGPNLRAAALAGNAAAEYEIAVRLADAQGGQDFAEAARWFERAANRGLAPAQFRLGGLYEKGIGVKKDVTAARRLYLAAAENGNAKAMHNLAVLHAEGVDGKPDYRTAGQWFRKAADRGVADSQYNLGVLYARGIGVEQNLAESYKWFTLAAAQGDKDAAKKRDDVAARLDPQSLMAARLAAQTFSPEPTSEEANTVKAPPGGWDGVPAEKPAKRKPRAAAPRPAAPPRDLLTTR
jgi:localization factor PodJL